jgi:hypothetical protein
LASASASRISGVFGGLPDGLALLPGKKMLRVPGGIFD